MEERTRGRKRLQMLEDLKFWRGQQKTEVLGDWETAQEKVPKTCCKADKWRSHKAFSEMKTTTTG